ncbi:MAG: sugar ABC transporter substrate-binding protein [Candidatus Izemoplasmatales bacterium]|jgi:ABC-type glycerol-3-phosphate transport system substrate-binding protein
MKKRFLLVFVVFLSIIPFIIGCNETTDNNTITVWWPSGKNLQNIMENSIVKYKESNPNIEIKIIKKAGLDVYDAYKIALNDNNSRPDIAILDHVYVQALAKENQLANLSDLGSDNDVRGLVPETVYAANIYNGANYGLPISANTVVLMYNKDILEKSGVTYVPKTYDELIDACEQVQNAGYTAFAQPINQTFVAMEFASYVGRLGGKMVSDDYRTVLLESQEVKEAINKWVGLSKFASQAEYEEGKFYSGKIAFIEMGSWNVSKVSGASSLFNCGFTEMVKLDDNHDNYSGLGLYSFVVAEKSSKKEEAYNFAKYLTTNKEFQLAFAKEKNLLPVTIEALNDPYYTENEVLSVFAKQLLKVTSRPGTAIWPTMEKAIVDMLYLCVKATSSDDIDRAIRNAQEQCQESTDREYK